MESVNVRNLEQIQEADGPGRGSRLVTVLLASAGGAALVIALVTMAKRGGEPAVSDQDPLGQLVAEASEKAAPVVPPSKLDGADVTFPALLSDASQPTTALAAVKDSRGKLVEQPGNLRQIEGTPPPAAAKLPVVPLPVGSLLASTPVTTVPKDDLTAMATTVSTPAADGEIAPAGNDDGVQIQVASFKDQQDADELVLALRKRGHQAFRQAAYVPDRGLWHRVRIGPFRSTYEAKQYAAKFEAAERMSPFVVDPQRVKRAEEIRAAKLEARKRKYGRE